MCGREVLVPALRALPLSPEFALSPSSSVSMMLSTGWWRTEMAAGTRVGASELGTVSGPE